MSDKVTRVVPFVPPKVRKKKRADDTLDSEWKAVPPLSLGLDQPLKASYTSHENLRAYRLFSIMDSDRKGCITKRKLFKLLFGDYVLTFKTLFDHADTGIVWGIDEANFVCIESLDKESPASLQPELINGLRLYRLNGKEIKPEGITALTRVEAILKEYQAKCDDDLDEDQSLSKFQLTLEFYDPLLIIDPLSCILDVEINAIPYSVSLPTAAYYDLRLLADVVHNTLDRTASPVQFVNIVVDTIQKKVTFTCDEFPFRLLFSRGPNYQRSCRAALGFAPEDYPYAYTHSGQPMAIDLNLKVNKQECNIIIREVFDRFDEDKSGDWSFEEFRDFYIKLLDTAAARELLKKYATERLIIIDRTVWWREIMKREREKVVKRIRRRALNQAIVTVQQKHMQETAVMDPDFILRRAFTHRRPDQQRVIYRKRVNDFEVFDEQKVQNLAIEDAATTPGQVNIPNKLYALPLKMPLLSTQASTSNLQKRTRKIMFRRESVDPKDERHHSATAAMLQLQSPQQEQKQRQQSSFVPPPMTFTKSETRLRIEERKHQMAALSPGNSTAVLSWADSVRGKSSNKKKLREKQRAQMAKRKRILAQLKEAAEKATKEKSKLHLMEMQKIRTTQMLEVHSDLRTGFAALLTMNESNFEGVSIIQTNIHKLSSNPALRLTSAIFGKSITDDDCAVEEVPSSHMHPAANRYYLLKKPQADVNSNTTATVSSILYNEKLIDMEEEEDHNKKHHHKKNKKASQGEQEDEEDDVKKEEVNNDDEISAQRFANRPGKYKAGYDPTMQHPAFFRSDYTREASRASSLGLGVVRLISREREQGLQYRAARGIRYVANRKIPKEDVIPPKKQPKIAMVLGREDSYFPMKVDEEIGKREDAVRRASLQQVANSNNEALADVHDDDDDEPGDDGDENGQRKRLRRTVTFDDNHNQNQGEGGPDLAASASALPSAVIVVPGANGAADVAGRKTPSPAAPNLLAGIAGMGGGLKRGSVVTPAATGAAAGGGGGAIDEDGTAIAVLPDESKVVAKIKVYTVKLCALSAAHLLKKNSPFVTMTCGSQSYTSEVKANAGDSVVWTDLNWSFDLDADEELSLNVSSTMLAVDMHHALPASRSSTAAMPAADDKNVIVPEDHPLGDEEKQEQDSKAKVPATSSSKKKPTPVVDNSQPEIHQYLNPIPIGQYVIDVKGFVEGLPLAATTRRAAAGDELMQLEGPLMRVSTVVDKVKNSLLPMLQAALAKEEEEEPGARQTEVAPSRENHGKKTHRFRLLRRLVDDAVRRKHLRGASSLMKNMMTVSSTIVDTIDTGKVYIVFSVELMRKDLENEMNLDPWISKQEVVERRRAARLRRKQVRMDVQLTKSEVIAETIAKINVPDAAVQRQLSIQLSSGRLTPNTRDKRSSDQSKMQGSRSAPTIPTITNGGHGDGDDDENLKRILSGGLSAKSSLSREGSFKTKKSVTIGGETEPPLLVVPVSPTAAAASQPEYLKNRSTPLTTARTARSQLAGEEEEEKKSWSLRMLITNATVDDVPQLLVSTLGKQEVKMVALSESGWEGEAKATVNAGFTITWNNPFTSSFRVQHIVTDTNDTETNAALMPGSVVESPISLSSGRAPGKVQPPAIVPPLPTAAATGTGSLANSRRSTLSEHPHPLLGSITEGGNNENEIEVKGVYVEVSAGVEVFGSIMISPKMIKTLYQNSEDGHIAFSGPLMDGAVKKGRFGLMAVISKYTEQLESQLDDEEPSMISFHAAEVESEGGNLLAGQPADDPNSSTDGLAIVMQPTPSAAEGAVMVPSVSTAAAGVDTVVPVPVSAGAPQPTPESIAATPVQASVNASDSGTGTASAPTAAVTLAATAAGTIPQTGQVATPPISGMNRLLAVVQPSRRSSAGTASAPRSRAGSVGILAAATNTLTSAMTFSGSGHATQNPMQVANATAGQSPLTANRMFPAPFRNLSSRSFLLGYRDSESATDIHTSVDSSSSQNDDDDNGPPRMRDPLMRERTATDVDSSLASSSTATAASSEVNTARIVAESEAPTVTASATSSRQVSRQASSRGLLSREASSRGGLSREASSRGGLSRDPSARGISRESSHRGMMSREPSARAVTREMSSRGMLLPRIEDEPSREGLNSPPRGSFLQLSSASQHTSPSPIAGATFFSDSPTSMQSPTALQVSAADETDMGLQPRQVEVGPNGGSTSEALVSSTVANPVAAPVPSNSNAVSNSRPRLFIDTEGEQPRATLESPAPNSLQQGSVAASVRTRNSAAGSSLCSRGSRSTVASRALSVTTATPEYIMVDCFDIDIKDLVLPERLLAHTDGHTGAGTSLCMRVDCNKWRSKTKTAHGCTDTVSWQDVHWIFKMSLMTFVRFQVCHESTVIGSVAVSTREIIENPKDKAGYCTLTRYLEDEETDRVGSLKITMRVDITNFEVNKGISSMSNKRKSLAAAGGLLGGASRGSAAAGMPASPSGLSSPGTLNAGGSLMDLEMPSSLTLPTIPAPRSPGAGFSAMASIADTEEEGFFEKGGDDDRSFASAPQQMLLAVPLSPTASIPGSPKSAFGAGLEEEEALSSSQQPAYDVAMIRFDLITAVDLDITIGTKLYVEACVGQWCGVSKEALVISGMVSWGYLNWPPLVIEQGTVLTVKVHRAEKMVKDAEAENDEDCLGSFAISGRKVFHSPKGADDCVAVSGKLVDLERSHGKISVILNVSFPDVAAMVQPTGDNDSAAASWGFQNGQTSASLDGSSLLSPSGSTILTRRSTKREQAATPVSAALAPWTPIDESLPGRPKRGERKPAIVPDVINDGDISPRGAMMIQPSKVNEPENLARLAEAERERVRKMHEEKVKRKEHALSKLGSSAKFVVDMEDEASRKSELKKKRSFKTKYVTDKEKQFYRDFRGESWDRSLSDDESELSSDVSSFRYITSIPDDAMSGLGSRSSRNQRKSTLALLLRPKTSRGVEELMEPPYSDPSVQVSNMIIEGDGTDREEEEDEGNGPHILAAPSALTDSYEDDKFEAEVPISDADAAEIVQPQAAGSQTVLRKDVSWKNEDQIVLHDELQDYDDDHDQQLMDPNTAGYEYGASSQDFFQAYAEEEAAYFAEFSEMVEEMLFDISALDWPILEGVSFRSKRSKMKGDTAVHVYSGVQPGTHFGGVIEAHQDEGDGDAVGRSLVPSAAAAAAVESPFIPATVGSIDNGLNTQEMREIRSAAKGYVESIIDRAVGAFVALADEGDYLYSGYGGDEDGAGYGYGGWNDGGQGFGNYESERPHNSQPVESATATAPSHAGITGVDDLEVVFRDSNAIVKYTALIAMQQIVQIGATRAVFQITQGFLRGQSFGGEEEEEGVVGSQEHSLRSPAAIDYEDTDSEDGSEGERNERWMAVAGLTAVHGDELPKAFAQAEVEGKQLPPHLAAAMERLRRQFSKELAIDPNAEVEAPTSMEAHAATAETLKADAQTDAGNNHFSLAALTTVMKAQEKLNEKIGFSHYKRRKGIFIAKDGMAALHENVVGGFGVKKFKALDARSEESGKTTTRSRKTLAEMRKEALLKAVQGELNEEDDDEADRAIEEALERGDGTADELQGLVDSGDITGEDLRKVKLRMQRKRRRRGMFMNPKYVRDHIVTGYENEGPDLDSIAHELALFENHKEDIDKTVARPVVKVPRRAVFTFLELLDVDFTSCLDALEHFPNQPYLTARRALGNWACTTVPFFWDGGERSEEDMYLSWMELSNKQHGSGWDPLVLKTGQYVVMEIHDAETGMIVALAKLDFSFLIVHPRGEDNRINVVVQFYITNHFGGGTALGTLVAHVDTSPPPEPVPYRPASYWDQHRLQHWKRYPVTPIAVGQVRHMYGEIAQEYDRQMIIHPAFFGFNVRWKGHPEEESRFIHPMFHGYNLAKQPLSKKQADEVHHQSSALGTFSNPFKWDPSAARLGKCPVCQDGLPGCPYCYMLPHRPNGERCTPKEFEYEPVKFAEEKAEEEKKRKEAERKEEEKRKRRLRIILSNNKRLLAAEEAKEEQEQEESFTESQIKAAFESSTLTPTSAVVPSGFATFRKTTARPDTIRAGAATARSVDSAHHDMYGDDEEQALRRVQIKIHTVLTTYLAIREYRRIEQGHMHVYIKCMPGGHVVKLTAEPSDTVFHLYNMFNAHTRYGNSKGAMILLPTDNGMFEMDNTQERENEHTLANMSAFLPLSKYGFRRKGSVTVLLHFQFYQPAQASLILHDYLSRNSDFETHKKLPIFYKLEKLPDDIHNGKTQELLRMLTVRQFLDQQQLVKEKFVRMAEEYRFQYKRLQVESSIKRRQQNVVPALDTGGGGGSVADKDNDELSRFAQDLVKKLPEEQRTEVLRAIYLRNTQGKLAAHEMVSLLPGYSVDLDDYLGATAARLAASSAVAEVTNAPPQDKNISHPKKSMAEVVNTALKKYEKYVERLHHRQQAVRRRSQALLAEGSGMDSMQQGSIQLLEHNVD